MLLIATPKSPTAERLTLTREAFSYGGGRHTAGQFHILLLAPAPETGRSLRSGNLQKINHYSDS